MSCRVNLSLRCVGPWKALPPKRMDDKGKERPRGRDWTPLGFSGSLLGSVHPINPAAVLGSFSVWCHWHHHWLLRTLATLKQLTVSQGSDEFFTFPGGLCRDSGTLLLASIPRVAWRNPHMTSAEPGPTLLGVLTMLYLRSHQKRRGFKTGLQGLKCKVSTVSVAALCHLPSLRA